MMQPKSEKTPLFVRKNKESGQWRSWDAAGLETAGRKLGGKNWRPRADFAKEQPGKLNSENAGSSLKTPI
jgi:hypothetical protein